MARKEIEITITGPGRDYGKTFLIREMSPAQAERFTLRAVLAAGIEEECDGWTALRSLMKINFAAAEPLLDEMMTCVTPAEEIEEAGTIWVLRMEVVKLHENPKALPIPERMEAHDGRTLH